MIDSLDDIIFDFKERDMKRLFLGVTSGRSGMKWFCDLVTTHNDVSGGGERDAAESFYRYVSYIIYL